MQPKRIVSAATLVAAAVAGSSVLAGQTQAPAAPQAPPMQLVLAGKMFVPPIRGEALVEYTAPVSRRQGDVVVTRVMVRNAVQAPIARLTIDETWYGKDDSVVTGGKGVIAGLLQPGEVQTIVIETPFRPGMNANNFNFSHVNGTVKPVRVPQLEETEPDAPTS